MLCDAACAAVFTLRSMLCATLRVALCIKNDRPTSYFKEGQHFESIVKQYESIWNANNRKYKNNCWKFGTNLYSNLPK